MEPLRIAVMPINEAKSFQDDLQKEGIDLVLNHNEKTCTRGCSVTVEVLGYEKDLPKIIEKYESNYKKLLDDAKKLFNKENLEELATNNISYKDLMKIYTKIEDLCNENNSLLIFNLCKIRI